MGYLIQWDNQEKTVVLQQYIDNPVKTDLYALAEQSEPVFISLCTVRLEH